MNALAPVALGLCFALIAASPGFGQASDGLRRDGARPLDAQPESGPAEAASLDPVLKEQFDEIEAVPGQLLSLRLSVLVPTSLTKPPVWPSLETPNLLVRLPERATGPISERINGSTWSGVSRHYRISPMVPGPFALPAQEIAIEWANPEGGAPLTATLQTEPIAFEGLVPEGAGQLDPFLAARSFTLTQTLEGETEALSPGDSLKLTLVATIDGTSPMFIPPLLPVPALEGLKAYPEDAVLNETSNRGVFGGTRTETVTLVAEGGGGGTIPGLEFSWYNLAKGSVDTATTSDVTLRVDGPPASSAPTMTDPRATVRRVALVAAASIALLLLLRFMGPRILASLQRRRAASFASEGYAWNQLKRCIAQKDLNAVRVALDLWARRLGGGNPLKDADVATALTAIGRAKFGNVTQGSPSTAWSDLEAALTSVRRSTQKKETQQVLPPLNPAE